MARKKSVTASSSRMESEFRELGRKLDGLVGKSRVAETRVRAKYAKQIKALKTKQAAAKLTLDRLKRQSAAAGAPLKAGFKKAWRDIDAAVRQATKRFRETA